MVPARLDAGGGERRDPAGAGRLPAADARLRHRRLRAAGARRCCCGSACSARSPCGCSCTCTSGPTCRWCWACGPAMPTPRRGARARVMLFARLNLVLACRSRSPWWRRRTSTDVADGAAASAAAARRRRRVRARRRARPLPCRPAGPAAPRAPTCWRWRHSPASWRACRPLVTREPAMGEIRLQWWRDALRPATPARAPAIPSPTPCARPCSATTCRAPLLLDIDRCARRSTSPGSPCADDAALADLSVEKRGRAVCSGRTHPRVATPGADVQAAARACGQRLRSGAAPARAAARAVPRAPAAAAIAPGGRRA